MSEKTPSSEHSSKTATDFGLSALLKLAWPIVLARSAQAVVGFCDALMVADLGEAELAAVTTGAMNYFAIVVFPMGAMYIVQSFASQLSTSGDMSAARRYAHYGLIFAAMVAVASLATFPIIEPILHSLPFEGVVAGHMTDYMEIRWLSAALFIGVETLGNWYGGLGNTRIHMMAAFINMVANVALNWLLIYGNLGAPALGVEGAAWASLAATALGFVFIVLVFARRGFTTDTAVAGRLRMSEFRRMLRFGIPSGFNWFLEFAAFVAFINVGVAYLGTRILAAFNIVVAINHVAFMPAFAIGSAGAILVGQAFGARDRDQVPGVVLRTACVAMAWTGTVGLIYLLFPRQLFELFRPPGEDVAELVAIGTTMLAMSAAWQLFDAVGLTLGECLRGAGDTTWPMTARLIIAWGIFAPGSLISIRYADGGYIAVMMWLIIYLSLLSLALVYRFRKGAWRNIDLAGLDEALVG